MTTPQHGTRPYEEPRTRPLPDIAPPPPPAPPPAATQPATAQDDERDPDVAGGPGRGRPVAVALLFVLLGAGLLGASWLALQQNERAQRTETRLAQLTGQLETERADMTRLRAEADTLTGRVDSLSGQLDSAEGSLRSSQGEVGRLRAVNATCSAAIGTAERIQAGYREFIQAMSEGDFIRARLASTRMEPLWQTWEQESQQCRGSLSSARRSLDGV